jgi:phospholipid transport system transporter-binding protein
MITRKDDCLHVSGNLTMDTVAELYNTSLKPEAGDKLMIDLLQVEIADSAAVSLLLSWLRRAQREKLTLSFVHVPENLFSLARLYGVDELLPLYTPLSLT